MADQEAIVLRLRRGRRGRIEISRVREADGSRSTRACMWYPTGEGDELRRGAALTFRGSDEHEKLAALFSAIAKRERSAEVLGQSFAEVTPAPEQAKRPQHRTILASDLDDEKGLF